MNALSPQITDVLILGTGVAGLRAALALDPSVKVLLVAKDPWKESCSSFAQGGVAAALAPGDSPEAHFEDTFLAGASHCNPEAVRILTHEGPWRVEELIRWGARFDRENGAFHLGLEGGHRRRRIFHAGDATGEEIVRTLVSQIQDRPRVRWRTGLFSVSLIQVENRCWGAWFLDESGSWIPILARATILASGGAGQVYARTTNPPGATGDGMAMALRAGIPLKDMEFVQFHPTALALEGAPGFLLSEALRGEGAFLRNGEGERFLLRYDPRGELAPRDVVARAMVEEMRRTGTSCVYLDLTHLPVPSLSRRFPHLYQACQEWGIDWARDWIPVSPSAHFFIGGIPTDLWGRTPLPGLLAAGEVACTGVHGANRLASNSLLEALVFGARAGQAASSLDPLPMPSRFPPPPEGQPQDLDPFRALRPQLQRRMWEQVGLLREKQGLEAAFSWIQQHLPPAPPPHREAWEVYNLFWVAREVVQAALRRPHSLGVHHRVDDPQASR